MTKEEINDYVEKRVEEELKGKYNPDMLGYLNLFEKRKKEILKEEFGIDYMTIQEKHPGEMID